MLADVPCLEYRVFQQARGRALAGSVWQALTDSDCVAEGNSRPRRLNGSLPAGSWFTVHAALNPLKISGRWSNF